LAKRQDDEKQLIDSAKKDIANFKPLYERYVKVLFRYCYYRVGRNKEQAEDIVSETFVRAIDNFKKFKYKNKPFIVWLYTIAHNLVIDYYREKSPSISLDSLPFEVKDETDEIVDKLSKEELKEQIQDKTSDLPGEINHLFTLKHTEGLTFAEIGKLIGKTEGAVKMQYYRGLEQLKYLLNS